MRDTSHWYSGRLEIVQANAILVVLDTRQQPGGRLKTIIPGLGVYQRLSRSEGQTEQETEAEAGGKPTMREHASSSRLAGLDVHVLACASGHRFVVAVPGCGESALVSAERGHSGSYQNGAARSAVKRGSARARFREALPGKPYPTRVVP
eukprot:scaffold30_cov416-Prasinococcus_capsulatus_cf.AAC.8